MGNYLVQFQLINTMEEFESQEYRNELANKLKQTRNEEGRESGKVLLNEERETAIYKVSALLNELKKRLPKEYLGYLESFLKPGDLEALHETFEITDISDKLTPEHRLVVESEILENFYYHLYRGNNSWLPKEIREKFMEMKNTLFPGQDEERWGIKEGPEIINEISDGALYDNHNFTHVVLGQKTTETGRKNLVQPFNPESTIVGGTMGNNEFYVDPGYNGYASQLNGTLIVLSPQSLASRKFIEAILSDPGVYQDKNKPRLGENDRGDLGYGTEDYGHSRSVKTYALLFLANYPMIEHQDGIPLPLKDKEFKWSDISTKMVNLASGRLYERKQTELETEEVQESIQFYRNLLKNESGIDLVPDQEKFDKDSTKPS